MCAWVCGRLCDVYKCVGVNVYVGNGAGEGP